MAEKQTNDKSTDKKTATAKKNASTVKQSQTKQTETVDTKKEKVAAASKTQEKSGGGVVAAVIDRFKTDRKLRTVVMSVTASVLVLAILFGVIFGVRSCNRFEGPNVSNVTVNVTNGQASEITGGYEKGYSKAPQTAQYLGEVKPTIPVSGVYDEHEKFGVEVYPSYGKNLGTLPTEKFMAVFQECRDLIPGSTWHSNKTYYYIDSAGYLLDVNGERIAYSLNAGGDGTSGSGETDDNYVGGVEEGTESEAGASDTAAQFNLKYRMLYKHITAATIYGGGLSDDEPRIVKEISFLTKTGIASKQITGLYAPGGELIKIEMSEEDFAKSNGVQVYIGQNYNIDGNDGVSLEWKNSGGNSTAKGNGFNRMPNILSHFSFAVNAPETVVTHKNGIVTFYVGSFWGGPIYIRPNSNSVAQNISVKFTGGVRYQHFILGATTPEEYEYNASSTAPYFDLEIYDSAIRFTTGIAGAESLRKMTYENCTDAAILWDKITQVSTRVAPNGLSSPNAPINFIGDCYIAAGAAYANPGRNGVVCPPGWVASALDYNSFVNGGSWGAMHEYNHCWQGYGLSYGGEVTNNATTLVSYTLYTRISQSRTAAVNWGDGGWNRYTDPAKSLGTLLQQSNSGTADAPQKCFDLPLYATLIHNIGQDDFVEAAKGGSYFDNLVNATHYDMTYYFRDILNFDVGDTYRADGTISQSVINDVKAKGYPMFVPVASVYQVGRSVVYDNEKSYITTAQPFVYGSGEYTMNFNNRNNFANGQFVSKELVIPDGFTVTVKEVTQPQHGKVELLNNNYVKYTPEKGENGLYSGEFLVTLGITKNGGEFTVADVDLVVNLKQKTSTDLYRTTYAYDDASNVPATDSVYNAQTNTFDFGQYSETETIKNVCTQNSNTEIWTATKNFYDDVYDAASTNFKEYAVGKTVQSLEGALYFPSANTYRVTLRGRGKITLYLSYDNGSTWEQAMNIQRTSGNAFVAAEYVEHKFTEDNNYVLFK
ncbi:MAG: M60 family metallopeptidase, partial [Firmicutes bacterium]|nr:M60 family metallopeptidase [Bacillota bacterium]